MRAALAVAISASVSVLLALNASAEDVPYKYKRYKAPPSYAQRCVPTPSTGSATWSCCGT